MSIENVELLRRANEAFNRGDFDAFLALCHEDLEIEDLNRAPDLPRVSRGKAEALQAFAAWTDTFEDFSGEIEEYIDVDEWHVGCVVRYRGTNRAMGLEVEFRGVDMWEVRERKLARGTLGYPDRESAVEHVEQQE
jgi:ketosteroid isomerase-like protein